MANPLLTQRREEREEESTDCGDRQELGEEPRNGLD